MRQIERDSGKTDAGANFAEGEIGGERRVALRFQEKVSLARDSLTTGRPPCWARGNIVSVLVLGRAMGDGMELAQRYRDELYIYPDISPSRDLVHCGRGRAEVLDGSGWAGIR
jgi:hypothetical protein